MEEAHERGARRPAGSFRTLALLLLSAGALVLWRAQPWQAPDELLVDDRRHDGAGPMERGADSRALLDNFFDALSSKSRRPAQHWRRASSTSGVLGGFFRKLSFTDELRRPDQSSHDPRDDRLAGSVQSLAEAESAHHDVHGPVKGRDELLKTAKRAFLAGEKSAGRSFLEGTQNFLHKLADAESLQSAPRKQDLVLHSVNGGRHMPAIAQKTTSLFSLDGFLNQLESGIASLFGGGKETHADQMRSMMQGDDSTADSGFLPSIFTPKPKPWTQQTVAWGTEPANTADAGALHDKGALQPALPQHEKQQTLRHDVGSAGKAYAAERAHLAQKREANKMEMRKKLAVEYNALASRITRNGLLPASHGLRHSSDPVRSLSSPQAPAQASQHEDDHGIAAGVLTADSKERESVVRNHNELAYTGHKGDLNVIMGAFDRLRLQQHRRPEQIQHKAVTKKPLIQLSISSRLHDATAGLISGEESVARKHNTPGVQVSEEDDNGVARKHNTPGVQVSVEDDNGVARKHKTPGVQISAEDEHGVAAGALTAGSNEGESVVRNHDTPGVQISAEDDNGIAAGLMRADQSENGEESALSTMKQLGISGGSSDGESAISTMNNLGVGGDDGVESAFSTSKRLGIHPSEDAQHQHLDIAGILNKKSNIPDPFGGRDGMGGSKKEGTGKPQIEGPSVFDEVSRMQDAVKAVGGAGSLGAPPSIEHPRSNGFGGLSREMRAAATPAASSSSSRSKEGWFSPTTVQDPLQEQDNGLNGAQNNGKETQEEEAAKRLSAEVEREDEEKERMMKIKAAEKKREEEQAREEAKQRQQREEAEEREDNASLPALGPQPGQTAADLHFGPTESKPNSGLGLSHTTIHGEHLNIAGILKNSDVPDPFQGRDGMGGSTKEGTGEQLSEGPSVFSEVSRTEKGLASAGGAGMIGMPPSLEHPNSNGIGGLSPEARAAAASTSSTSSPTSSAEEEAKDVETNPFSAPDPLSDDATDEAIVDDHQQRSDHGAQGAHPTLVAMAVSLQMSESDFDRSEQAVFKESIASLVGTSSQDIRIDYIARLGSQQRRRLLERDAIRVDFIIRVADLSVATKLTPDAINAQLRKTGLPSVRVLEPWHPVTEAEEKNRVKKFADEMKREAEVKAAAAEEKEVARHDEEMRVFDEAKERKAAADLYSRKAQSDKKNGIGDIGKIMRESSVPDPFAGMDGTGGVLSKPPGGEDDPSVFGEVERTKKSLTSAGPLGAPPSLAHPHSSLGGMSREEREAASPLPATSQRSVAPTSFTQESEAKEAEADPMAAPDPLHDDDAGDQDGEVGMPVTSREGTNAMEEATNEVESREDTHEETAQKVEGEEAAHGEAGKEVKKETKADPSPSVSASKGDNDDLSLGPPATLAPDTFQEEDMKSGEKLNIANILNSQSDLPDPFKGRDGMGGLKKEGTGKPQAEGPSVFSEVSRTEKGLATAGPLGMPPSVEHPHSSGLGGLSRDERAAAEPPSKHPHSSLGGMSREEREAASPLPATSQRSVAPTSFTQESEAKEAEADPMAAPDPLHDDDAGDQDGEVGMPVTSREGTNAMEEATNEVESREDTHEETAQKVEGEEAAHGEAGKEVKKETKADPSPSVSASKGDNDDLSLGPPATLAPDTFQEEDMKSGEKLNIANILNSQSDLPDPFKGRDGMGGLKKEGTGKPQAEGPSVFSEVSRTEKGLATAGPLGMPPSVEHPHSSGLGGLSRDERAAAESPQHQPASVAASTRGRGPGAASEASVLVSASPVLAVVDAAAAKAEREVVNEEEGKRPAAQSGPVREDGIERRAQELMRRVEQRIASEEAAGSQNERSG